MKRVYLRFCRSGAASFVLWTHAPCPASFR